MSEFTDYTPPELQDVQERFDLALNLAGIDGAERVVSELTTDVEIAESLALAVEAFERGEIPLSAMVVSALAELANMMDEVTADEMLAKQRLTYAAQLLEDVKNNR